MSDIEALNARLDEIVQSVYGGKVSLRIVDPKTIKLLRKNARFMKKATFDQLTANVKEDGALQSVPLCHTLKDGALECLSGNHRVKAAVKAGTPLVLVLVIPYELSRNKRISRQLSHNALSGQDDLTILSELWGEIDSLQERLYAGLDSETIGELDKIKFQGFGAEPIRTENVTLWFLPEEVADLRSLIEVYDGMASGSSIYLTPLKKYDKLFKALVNAKRNADIKNTAVAFMLLIDAMAEQEMAQDSACAVPFTEEQWTIVKGAIEMVRSGYDGPPDASNGRILELICADFLAGDMRGGSSGEDGGTTSAGSFDPSPPLHPKKKATKKKVAKKTPKKRARAKSKAA